MNYVFYLLIVVLAIVIWSMLSEKSYQKKLLIHLKEQWGNTPEEEYTSEKFKFIRAFYTSIQDSKLDVDDITWNDLDMDELYMQMNNTQSSIGEEYLYALLRKPCFSEKDLEERNRLIRFFQNNSEKRLLLQTKLHQMGKFSHISVFTYIDRLQAQESKSNVPHYLMILGLFVSIGLIFIKPGFGGICTVLMIFNNVFQYYKEKSLIENYLSVISYLFRMFDNTKKICQLDIPEITGYTEILKKDVDFFRRVRIGSIFLAPKNPNGSILDAIFDYIRMLFHLDLIKYNSLLSFFKNHRDVLNRIFINIGLIDSMIAVASFRDMISDYCEPELLKSKQPQIAVTDLYHPLLETPVPNSIVENRSVLLTGSNASGKSTFIKTLAINAILAQTIFTSTSKRYVASYFMIYSSMALRDNIFSSESYYIVEIKSLKRILDCVNSEIPALCFIDEVLRGTNTLERIAASSRILSSLARKNTLVFAATHDIELTHILEQDYSNYHFQERIDDNKILFDYKLYQGKAISKNAIKLLGMLGYPKEIISSAENAADEFLAKGEWSNLTV